MTIALSLRRLCSKLSRPAPRIIHCRPSRRGFAKLIIISLSSHASITLAANINSNSNHAGASTNANPSASTHTDQTRVTPDKATQICEQSTQENDAIAQTQDYLETIGCKTAFWIDGIGGNSASAAAAKRTTGYLRLSTEMTEYGGFEIKLKGQLDSELPYLEKRLSAFIGRGSERAETRSRSSNFNTDNLFSQASDDEWLVGLGYRIPRFDKFDTSAKAGVTSLNLPKLFFQATGRVVIHDTPTSLSDAFIRPFWTNRDGAGLTIQSSVSKALAAPDYIVRLAQVSSITEKTRGLKWAANLTLFQRINQTTGLAWQIRAAGETEAAESLGVYGASVNYRLPLGELISEWRVSYNFPRASLEEERTGSAGLSIELKLPFGK